MAENVGEVVVVICADNEAFKESLKATNNALKQLKKNAEMLNRAKATVTAKLDDRVSRPLKLLQSQLRGLSKVYKIGVDIKDRATDKIKGIVRTLTSPLAIMGAGAGVTGLVGWPLKLAGEMEQARLSMDFFTGSAVRGKKMLEDLVTFAAKTPFEFSFVREMAVGLLPVYRAAYNVDTAIKKTLEAIQAFGNAAGYTGASMERIQLALLGFKQIATSGTLQMEELRQITENLMVPMDIFVKELGISKNELRDIGKQGIPAAKAMDAIVRALSKNYGGGMKKMSQTLFGLLSTVKDMATFIFTSFGTGMLGPVKRILLDLAGTMDFTSPKFQAFLKRVEKFGKKFGDVLYKAYESGKKYLSMLFSGDMANFPIRFIDVFNRVLDNVKKWLDSSASKKFQQSLVKIGEILARTWLKILEGVGKGLIEEIKKGNVLGAAVFGTLLWTLGGGLIAKAGAKGLQFGLKGLEKLVSKAGKGAKVAEGVATTEEVVSAAAKAGQRGLSIFAKGSGLLRNLGRIAVPLAVIGGAVDIAISRNKKEAVGRVTGGLAGGLAGAKVGALIGSFFGPVGTGVGAVIGGIAGGFGGEKLGALLSKLTLTKVKEFSNKIPFMLGQALGQAFGYVSEFVASAVAKIGEGIGKLSKMSLSDLALKILSVGVKRINEGLNNLETARKQIAVIFSKAVKGIGDFLGNALDWVKRLARSIYTNFTNFIQGFKQGFVAVSGQDKGKATTTKQMSLKKHATGGIVTKPHIGLIGEVGPEAIIPLSKRFRRSALNLWIQTGELLGVNVQRQAVAPVAIQTATTGINVNVNGLTVQLNNAVDEQELALKIGYEILKHVKRALQNRG